MAERGLIFRYVGSIVHERGKGGTLPPSIDNQTDIDGGGPITYDDTTGGKDFSEKYTMIVISLSTLLPVLFLLISAVIARKIWLKLRDQPGSVESKDGDATRSSVKSAEIGNARKSRSGSRISKSEQSIVSQLLSFEEMLRQPSMRVGGPQRGAPSSSSYIVFREEDESEEDILITDSKSFVHSPMIRHQTESIDIQINEPAISPDGDPLSTSEQPPSGATSIDMMVGDDDEDDEGGFGDPRSPRTRNQSLKVDVESIPSYRHQRSHSDAGRNRRRGESAKMPHDDRAENDATRASLLATPDLKIRKSTTKSHSMRYRSDVSPAPSRARSPSGVREGSPRHLTAHASYGPETTITSPSLHRRRSPQQQPSIHHHDLSHKRRLSHHGGYQYQSPTRGEPQDPPRGSHERMEPEAVGETIDQDSNENTEFGSQTLNRGNALYGQSVKDKRPKKLHLASQQSETFRVDDYKRRMSERKKSLPNVFDFPLPELKAHPQQSSSVTVDRNISLNKQVSLPSAVRSGRPQPTKGAGGAHHRHHVSLRHDPVTTQRYLEAPNLTRRASCRERIGGTELEAWRLANRGQGDRQGGRSSGSFNLGSVSPRSPGVIHLQETILSPRVLHNLTPVLSPRPSTKSEKQFP